MRRIALAFSLLLGLSQAAFALTSSPTVCVTPINKIANSNAGTPVAILTTPASGAKITNINFAVNDSTHTYTAVLQLTDGVTTIQYGQFTVPSGSGYTLGLGLFNYFQNIPGLPIDSDGKRYLIVEPGQTLKFAQGSSSSGGTATGLQISIQGCQFQ